MYTDAEYLLACVSSAQFKAMKAAIRLLWRAGIPREQAVNIILDAHRKAYHPEVNHLGKRLA